MITSVFIGFQGLYATLVCVACSQFEKIRANISLIGDGQLNMTQGSREGMLEHLRDCIRHHQMAIQWVYTHTAGVITELRYRLCVLHNKLLLLAGISKSSRGR